MVSIIVADDEENVRDLVVGFINNNLEGYTVVAKADNGKEALELVKQHKPDILISDICMPGMDGLELISQINKLELNVKCVIISGYSEFAYAKKAVSLGVSEYLLKPISPDELIETLDKMSDEITRKEMLEKNMEYLEDTVRKNKKIQVENIVKSLLSGECSDDELLDTQNRFGIEILSDMYCVCDIFIEEDQNNTVSKIFGEFFENINEAYFDSRIKVYAMPVKAKHCIVLFTGNYQNDISFRNFIRKGLKSIADGMEKYYDITIRSYIGKTYHDWNNIPSSLKEAEIIWKSIIEDSENVLFYSEYEKNNENAAHELVRPDDMERELFVQVQMNRKEDAANSIEQIIRYYEMYPLSAQSFITISCMELLLDMCRLAKEAGGSVDIWNDEHSQEMQKYFQKGTLLQIKEVLVKYAWICCEEFERINETQSDKIVSVVKELIEKNISNDEFNLDDISQQLYFSTHYIRQVFKQKTGDNILEYMIQRRMECAGELLKNPENKITEIAERTGYKNQRYFATAFKKYYGSTPTEYRKQFWD